MSNPEKPVRRKARIDWVDYAKGICILLVVMMHSTLGVEKAAGDTGWLGYVVEFSRPFRMPDFFVDFRPVSRTGDWTEPGCAISTGKWSISSISMCFG